jgi:hypothetical protein
MACSPETSVAMLSVVEAALLLLSLLSLLAAAERVWRNQLLHAHKDWLGPVLFRFGSQTSCGVGWSPLCLHDPTAQCRRDGFVIRSLCAAQLQLRTKFLQRRHYAAVVRTAGCQSSSDGATNSGDRLPHHTIEHDLRESPARRCSLHPVRPSSLARRHRDKRRIESAGAKPLP